MFWLLQLALTLALSKGDELLAVHVSFRHGSKVPDIPFVNTTAFWEPIGNPGFYSSVGQLEMNAFGSFLRRKYITEEQLVPDRFDQTLVYARASSANNARPLQSMGSLMQTLYPGAPVPIYTVPVEHEFLIGGRSHTKCCSFFAEYPRILKEYDEFLETNYATYIDRVREISGLSELRPSNLVYSIEDNYVMQLNHDFPDIDTFLRENDLLVRHLKADWNFEMIKSHEPDDPRGTIYNHFARQMIQDLEGSISGSTSTRLFLYGGHDNTVRGTMSALGLLTSQTARVDVGEAFITEVRRAELNGLIYVRSYFAGRDGLEYIEKPRTLNCPNPSLTCPLDELLAYIDQRNIDGGCAVRSPGFYELGCGNFLNPDVLNIPECALWREWCPETACDTGQVLDAETFLCIPVGAQN